MKHQKRKKVLYPNGKIEKALFNQGFSYVSGVDEVGRGALAGPMVACAVTANSKQVQLLKKLKVRDSKMVAEDKREELYDKLLAVLNGGYSISSISSSDIDTKGLSYANNFVLEQAILTLKDTPEYVLVDGFYINSINIKQEKIIHGDEMSVVIATASVIAKVTRDRLMRELAKEYPQYGFELHKGYGTAKHLDAISRHGYSPHHRKSFKVSI